MVSSATNKVLFYLLTLVLTIPLKAKTEERKDVLYMAAAETTIGKAAAGGMYAEWCLDYRNGGFSYYYAGPFFSHPVLPWLSAFCSAYYIWDSGFPYAIWPAAGLKAASHTDDISFFISESLTYDYSYIHKNSFFLRSRAGVSWHHSNSSFTPAFWIESYSWDEWMRVKSFIGSNIRITNQLSATIGYLRSFINGKDYRLNHLTLGVSANF